MIEQTALASYFLNTFTADPMLDGKVEGTTAWTYMCSPGYEAKTLYGIKAELLISQHAVELEPGAFRFSPTKDLPRNPDTLPAQEIHRLRQVAQEANVNMNRISIAEARHSRGESFATPHLGGSSICQCQRDGAWLYYRHEDCWRYTALLLRLHGQHQSAETMEKSLRRMEERFGAYHKQLGACLPQRSDNLCKHPSGRHTHSVLTALGAVTAAEFATAQHLGGAATEEVASLPADLDKPDRLAACARALTAFGHIQRLHGNLEEAKTTHLRAISLAVRADDASSIPVCRAGLARLHVEEGQLESAISELELALQVLPANDRASGVLLRAQLARCHRLTGNTQLALQITGNEISSAMSTLFRTSSPLIAEYFVAEAALAPELPREHQRLAEEAREMFTRNDWDEYLEVQMRLHAGQGSAWHPNGARQP